MSDKFKISIDDVQEFLSKVAGLKWDKTIFTEQGRIPATKLGDLKFKNNNPVAIRTIDRSNNPNIINIAVSPIYFATYVESFDYSDIDAVIEFAVEHDLSDLWIKFLVKKYGKDYQEYAEKFCQHEKNRLVVDTYSKVEALDSRKRAILEEHKSQLQKYANVEKLLYGIDNTKSFGKK